MLKLYYRLSTRSKRAFMRFKGRWGHKNHYRPRMALLKRLAVETGMSEQEVMEALYKEREWAKKYQKYIL